VIEGVGVLASSFVGVDGTVGVCEREEEFERDGMVIARRKRSLRGMLAIVVCEDYGLGMYVCEMERG
jgi:hypothetical protein